MNSTTNAAAEIRKQLKALGFAPKAISVRSDSYSMGSSIRVTVNDPAIPLAVVKKIAEQAEDIRRDEFSGEILSGGNRFVQVGYSEEARGVLIARNTDRVTAALASIPAGDASSLARVDGTSYWVGRQVGPFISLWGETHILNGSVPEIAYTVSQLTA